MNQRDDTQGNEHVERGREANGGRDYYPGSHGFDETHDRSYSQDAARHDRERWNNGFERQRHEQQQRGRWNAGRGGGDRGASWPSGRGAGEGPGGGGAYGSGQRTHWSEPQPLYGRQQPFGPPEDTHYYGTGSAGYGGPGFTGGAYAYGNGPRDDGRQVEDEYSDESAVSYEQGARPQYGRPPYAQPQYRQQHNPPYDQQYGRHFGRQFGQGQPYGQPYGNDRYSGGYPDARTRRFTTGPKGYQRSDERLKEDISERLMESHYIDSSDVSVEVRGAKVVLEGTVPSRHMKHAIEDLVDACPGVQDIDNRVRVASSSQHQGYGAQSHSLTGSNTGIGAGSNPSGGTSASGVNTPNSINTPNGTKTRS
jgi:hypothetical protein